MREIAFEWEINGRPLTIKFDYKTLYKIGKKYSTTKVDGLIFGDGVGVFYWRLRHLDSDALFDLVNLVSKEPINEKQFVTAISEYTEGFEDNQKGYETLFGQVIDEVFKSGLYIKQLHRHLRILKAYEKSVTNKYNKEEVKFYKELINFYEKELNERGD